MTLEQTQSPQLESILDQIMALPLDDQFSMLVRLTPVRREFDKKIGAGIESVVVTPEIAQDILENSNYGLQRDRRKSHVKRLASEMTQGRWLSLSMIQIVTHNPSGKQFLVDGQNRLAGVTLSGIPQEFLILRRYVDTMEEVRQIYVVLDRGLPRRPVDIFRALRFGQDEYNLEKFGTKEHPLSEKDQALAKSVIAVMMQGFHTVSTRNGGKSGNKITEEDYLALIDGITEATMGYLAAVKGSPQERRYLSSPVMSLGIATFLGPQMEPTIAPDVQVKAAYNFWTAAAHGTAKEGSASWMVGEVLRTNLSDQTRVGVLSRMLAHIWNKFKNKEVPKTVPQAADFDHQAMLRIIGSPWNGKDKVFLDLDGKFHTETQRQAQLAELRNSTKAQAASHKETQKEAQKALPAQTTLAAQIAAIELDEAESRFEEAPLPSEE